MKHFHLSERILVYDLSLQTFTCPWRKDMLHNSDTDDEKKKRLDNIRKIQKYNFKLVFRKSEKSISQYFLYIISPNSMVLFAGKFMVMPSFFILVVTFRIEGQLTKNQEHSVFFVLYLY